MNRDLLTALGRCRIIEKNQGVSVLHVSEEELNALEEEKLIAEEETIHQKQYYTLTEKGEKVLKEVVPDFGEIYRGFILEHDLRLMEFYLKRSVEERESWLTRDDMTKKYMFPGTVDGAFVNHEGVVEGVEVLSKTAKPSKVEQAEAFLKHANISQMNYLLY